MESRRICKTPLSLLALLQLASPACRFSVKLLSITLFPQSLPFKLGVRQLNCLDFFDTMTTNNDITYFMFLLKMLAVLVR